MTASATATTWSSSPNCCSSKWQTSTASPPTTKTWASPPTTEELIARDKTSLDIFWLRDKSLTDLDSLDDPDVLAQEIVENLESGLESFRAISVALEESNT